MNSILKLHMNQLIESIINDTYDNKSNCLFIKNYDDFCIDMDEIINYEEFKRNIKIINYEFSFDKMLSPYEPFLEWIRKIVKDYKIDIDILFEECKIYRLHRAILKNFIINGKCERNEDIIIPEIDYEEKLFKEGILRIVIYLSNISPTIFVLNNIHYAVVSTYEILKSYIENEEKGNMAIIATYNELYKVNDLYLNEWNKLINIAHNNNIIVDAVDNKGSRLEFKPFVMDFNNYKKYYLLINNMIETFALKEAKYYLTMIYQKLELEKVETDLDIRYEFIEMLTRVNLYLKDNTEALLLCDKLEKTVQNKPNSIKFRCSYIIGVTHIYTYEYELVKKDIENCRIYAESDFELFKLDLLECLAEYQGFKDVVLKKKKFIVNDLLIERAKKYNYYDNLAYIYAYCYGNAHDMFEENINFKVNYFEEGINLALHIGNDLCILEAYKKRVMVASWYAKFDLIEFCYNQCVKIIKKFNDKKEEAELYNGLGYLYSANEDYEKANEFYEKALQTLGDVKDLELLSTTYYNKTINCILAEDYKNGCKCIETTIDIMQKNNIFKLPVCNTSKIYGLAAICYYRMGLFYNCYLNIEIMKGYISHILNTNDDSKCYLWDDDLFMYNYAKGLLCVFEQKYNDAKESFKKAFFHITRSKGNQFFSYPQLSIEQAKVLKKLGDYKEAKSILENCINFCMDNKYYKTAEKVRCELISTYEFNSKMELKTDEEFINQAIIISSQSKIESENLILKRYINFIEIWQDLMTMGLEEKMLISNSMLILKNYFKLDQIIYLNLKENGYNIKYELKKSNLEFNEVNNLLIFLKSRTEGFVASRIERKFYLLKDIFINLDMNNIASFICVPIVENNKITDIIIAYIELHDNFTTNMTLLNNENLVILRSVFRQLNSEVAKLSFKAKIIEINTRLAVSNTELHHKAEIDSLTKLYNRHGMKRIIDDLTTNKKEERVVIYIDLDNFKYYNDTFGHVVGDLLLTQFSKLLLKIVEDNGYCIRYGGDEFIILLKHSDIFNAEEIVKKIIKEIEENNHFQDMIANYLEYEIVVPQNKKFTCSIGMASTDWNQGCDIYNAITRADGVLYSIKNTTKNNYGIYK